MRSSSIFVAAALIVRSRRLPGRNNARETARRELTTKSLFDLMAGCSDTGRRRRGNLIGAASPSVHGFTQLH